MGQAISYSLRESIIELRSQKVSYAQIGLSLNLPTDTVKKLYCRYQKTRTLLPAYGKCGHKGQLRSDYFFYRASLWLKRRHLDWGAPFIRLVLSERYGSDSLPSSRQLQRWFLTKQLNPPRQIKGGVAEKTTQAPHDRWQVDAKEQLKLADGSDATYLSVVDEHTGSSLGATLFPLCPYQSSPQ